MDRQSMAGQTGYETDAFELKRMMRQDAHEKAFEIHVQGQRIFERSRDSEVEMQGRLLNKEFEEKTNTLHINQKIAVSAKTNQVRLHRMTYRNKQLDKLRETAMEQLIQNLTNDEDKYRAVMKDLIVQGMIKMLEDEVELLVRDGDEDLINDLIPQCQEAYSQIMMESTGREYNTTLTLIDDRQMKNEEGAQAGGVILMAHERRIQVQNTLSDRLSLLFDLELPNIRRMLFPNGMEQQV